MEDCVTAQSGHLHIGQPIHFITGEFAGLTIRAELHEVQKANLGRKYARVDRRPLDPPPCAWLRLYRVYNAGTDRMTEVEIENYGDISSLGMLCHVDLFPVPDGAHTEPSSPGLTHSPPLYSLTTVSHHISHYEYREHRSSPNVHPSSSHRSLRVISHHGDMPSRTAQDIVWHHNSHPIRESSKMTSALVGSSCVEASRVQYKGREAFMFVFGDLAVSAEGTFILRYRAFDIFSKTAGGQDMYAISAECYGGSFRVYSTKNFPGLQPSTELSKNFARWGVRINIRERDRKRGNSESQTSTGDDRPDEEESWMRQV